MRQYLLTERGIEIAGGFGPLAGKVFRIGTHGLRFDRRECADAARRLEEALAEQGYRPAGDGPAAAERSLAAAV